MRHVALAFPFEAGHIHQVVRGITEFANEQGEWRFSTFSEPLEGSVKILGWQGDGMIAALRTEGDVRAAGDMGLPCVNISSSAESDDVFARVVVDNAAIGHLAAEHLLACGFRRFAYYGRDGIGYAMERGAGFIERLQQAEMTCQRHDAPADSPSSRRDPQLPEWLKQLEGPVALFAADDRLGRRAIDEALAIGINMPDQLAVLGVDNDRPTCEMSEHPMSSIACDWWRLGREAAAMLDLLMRGGNPATQNVMIPPLGVVRRWSTDVIIVENLHVARAAEFVRQHIDQVFGVEALLRAVGTSRRSLELEFKRTMGCTPYQFITRARLERAKTLLAMDRSANLSRIASACGFADLRRFRLVFRRHVGMSPAEFRSGSPPRASGGN
jgi:LacI family transcriptional regulator